jgi:hypothetical protein
MRRTAEPLKLKLHQFGVREPAEFEAAFAEMASKRIGALVVIDDANLLANAQTLAQMALRQRLPSSGWPDYAAAGGLLSYGVNFPDMFRRAANFVDKILKGAKPNDLPRRKADQIRDDCQPQNSPSHWHRSIDITPTARRRSNRIKDASRSCTCSWPVMAPFGHSISFR